MLKINTGNIILPIERDGKNVGEISFNPSDAFFIDKLYALYEKMDTKQKEYQKKATKLECKDLDEYGIPKNMRSQIELYNEACEYMCGEIDGLFGENTCKKVFGGTTNFELFEQFLNGIAEYVQPIRKERMSKYLNREQKRAAGLK